MAGGWPHGQRKLPSKVPVFILNRRSRSLTTLLKTWKQIKEPCYVMNQRLTQFCVLEFQQGENILALRGIAEPPLNMFENIMNSDSHQ